MQMGQLVGMLAQPECEMKCGMCMALCFGGRYIFAGYEDGNMAVWDPAAPEAPLCRHPFFAIKYNLTLLLMLINIILSNEPSATYSPFLYYFTYYHEIWPPT